ncbi:MAG TPA: fasciclin domain-containing protein [Micromonosporaceae bacterium]|nr:fasciclin domain-containing protein [Micromonosporaceae bacterium]
MSIARTLRPRRKLAAGALIATAALTAGPALATPAAAQPPRPFGPACAKVPANGPGSVADMANQPVATAAARNPLLSTLATAVGKAGLADTLNRAEALTVFAPTNDAFAKIPPATLNKVLADKKTLTSILTYHVVGARHTPADLADGRFKTLQGGTLTTAKKGDNYTVNGARVVCGNVQTRNATVYLIDTVLMPKS